MRVLVVEDYEPLARSLTQGLREAGYAVDVCMDGEAGLACAEDNPYDAIVLDLMLPKLDGLSLVRTLRKGKNPAAVLILTARDRLEDRVSGLDAGADDYLVKPFEFAELLARVRALIRRKYKVPETVINIGDLEVDTGARRARRGGVALSLSAREYKLLEYLAVRHGQTVTRTEIWEHLYDFVSDPSSNVVDVYIGYLRRKIDQDHAQKLIHTRRGLGYVLAAETD
jgi:DNA-binding response OmpR family regulator